MPIPQAMHLSQAEAAEGCIAWEIGIMRAEVGKEAEGGKRNVVSPEGGVGGCHSHPQPRRRRRRLDAPARAGGPSRPLLIHAQRPRTETGDSVEG